MVAHAEVWCGVVRWGLAAGWLADRVDGVPPCTGACSCFWRLLIAQHASSQVVVTARHTIPMLATCRSILAM